MTPMLRAIALSLALVAGASCASTDRLEPRWLPFHVVVVPIDAPIVGEVAPGELPGKATELVLDLDADELTRAVASALDEYCFTRVTVVDATRLGAAADVFERQRVVLEEARAARADLIVELGLRYDPQVFRDTTSTFWLNYPLFLFLSPSNWFLLDNSYFADAELSTTVYDVNVIEAGSFDIGDPAARVISASSRYGGTQLSFVDRTEGLSGYLLSILIPSGHLSRETPAALEEVRKDVIEELRSQVVQGIQSRRSDLVRADWIAPVSIDPDEVRITREGGEVVVRGVVRLRRGGLVDRVDAIHLEVGSVRTTVRPTPRAESAGLSHDAWGFEGRVAAPADARELRLECEAGSRDRFVRSYTFALPR